MTHSKEDKALRKMRRSVIFNKLTAIGWAIFGGVSFLFGWQNSVALVWMASVYANSKTDWGTAKAADNTEVMQGLKEMKDQVNNLTNLVMQLLEQRKEDTATDDISSP